MIDCIPAFTVVDLQAGQTCYSSQGDMVPLAIGNVHVGQLQLDDPISSVTGEGQPLISKLQSQVLVFLCVLR